MTYFIRYMLGKQSGLLVATILIMLQGTLMHGGDVAATHARDVTLGQEFTSRAVPIWTGNTLVAFEGEATSTLVIHSVDTNGRALQNLTFSIPGASALTPFSCARGSDGSLALVGSALSSDGRIGSFLSIIPVSQGSRIIRTSPYIPYRVTVSSDGTIWTSGYDWSRTSHAGEGILRHYDSSGNLLTSIVPQTTTPSTVMLRSGYMSASADRVSWYSGPDKGPGSFYFEVSTDGSIKEIPGVTLTDDESVSGLALLDSGNVFVSTYNWVTKTAQLFMLDRLTSRWKPINLSIPQSQKWSRLRGGSGNSLVVALSDNSKMSFYTTVITN